MDDRRRDELNRRRARLLEERGDLRRRLDALRSEFERREKRIGRTSIGFGIGGLVLNRVLWIERRLDAIAEELADIALEALTGQR